MPTPSVPLVRVFDRTWTAWLRGVRACEKTPARGAVHQLRIDARRLQALLEVLGHATEAPAKPRRRLAKIAGKPLSALALLRDDQVQRRRVARAPGSRGMEALLDHVRRRETRHERRARREIGRIDLASAERVARRVRNGVVRRQGAPTPQERTRLLITAVDTAATGVRSRLARVDADTPRTLHKLRIALKHFRYMVEIAEDVSPHVHAVPQPTLRSLQRRLGLVHDADVLLARIDRFTGRERRHREEVRAFRQTIESARAGHMRALSRSLPALRHALTDLAARASSGTAGQAL